MMVVDDSLCFDEFASCAPENAWMHQKAMIRMIPICVIVTNDHNLWWSENDHSDKLMISSDMINCSMHLNAQQIC